MKFLCKIKHKWKETFIVLTDHYPEISSIKPRFGNLVGFECFNHVRICERCGKEEFIHIGPFGTITWLSKEEAKRKYQEYRERNKKYEKGDPE